ncbi:hypothetical protein ACFVRB_06625 [Streptomyces nojiriensis]|uniref:hypothetical protein n=1 Tax=Streptomyces nojiriensis TaxID=66374 RepID=UPI0036DC31B6
MTKSARIAAASIVAALAIGVAAPVASAAQTASPAVSAVAVPRGGDVAAIGQFGGTAQAPAASPADVAAVQQAAENAKGKAFMELLKRTGGLFSKAVSKAKEGRAAFNNWMGDQHWSVRSAWWLLSGGVQTWVFEQLLNWVG